MVRTRPASSPGVSPLARSNTAKAAICAGVALPLMISSMAQAVSSEASSCPDMRAVRTPGQLVSAAGRPESAAGPPEAVTALPDDGDAGEPAAQLVSHDGGTLHRFDRRVDDRVGQRPAGQPAVLAARDEDDDRRTVLELVLELTGQPHAPGGLGLAVHDGEV